MTDNIWTSYAERRPTEADANSYGCIMQIDGCGNLRFGYWKDAGSLVSWARTADVLRATGYVTPRKLHPAWRELRADSWNAGRMFFVLCQEGGVPRTGGPFLYTTPIALGNHWTHWQPCDPPPVWEDEA